jgi:hypothetical protein
MNERKGIRPAMGEYLFDRYCQVVTGVDFPRLTGSLREVRMPEGKAAKHRFKDDFNKINDFDSVEVGLGSGIWQRG